MRAPSVIAAIAALAKLFCRCDTAAVSTRERKHYVRVAAAGEVPPLSGKLVEVAGQQIALFNLGDVFYAINDLCPHRGAPLSEGYLEGETVLCAWHCFDFSLRTGASETVPGLRVATYEVKVEGDEVFIAAPL